MRKIRFLSSFDIISRGNAKTSIFYPFLSRNVDVNNFNTFMGNVLKLDQPYKCKTKGMYLTTTICDLNSHSKEKN